MDGEIQIEDKIPIDYFVGIALPNINLNSLIDKIIKNTNTTITDDSYYRNIKLDLIQLSEEKFTNKYYQNVILFEKVLQETNTNIKLYHTETGEEIMT